MKPSKRQYRLQSVLKIREKYRDDAAIVVKNCLGEVEYSKLLISQTEYELEKKQKEIDDFVLSFDNEPFDGVSVAELRVQKEHTARLRKQRDSIEALRNRQQSQLFEREARLSDAQRTLETRIRELRVIEKHAEKWKKEEKKRTIRAEQREIDELGENFGKKG